MAVIEREKIYECEVKRRSKSPKGVYGTFWKLKVVADAIADEDTEFRCKDCHGSVKLPTRRVQHGPSPHVEHKSKEDSEYCSSGMYFRKATDGREHRISNSPVR